MEPEEIPKTAITSPFGLFQFTSKPFGLRNAAQTFQRLIDQLFRGLTFTFAYLDDILIASKDADEPKHLKILFKRLAEFGVILQPEKCIFSVSQVEFLGHIVDGHGIRPSPAKVREGENLPMPKILPNNLTASSGCPSSTVLNETSLSQHGIEKVKTLLQSSNRTKTADYYNTILFNSKEKSIFMKLIIFMNKL